MAAKESNGETEVAIQNVAIIFGVTGLVGRELARRLISKRKWKVYGVARHPETIPIQSSSYNFISCDLLNPIETKQKLSSLQDVTHVFWVTWASQHPQHTPECSEQNKAMMSNALNAMLPRAKALKHFSLQTGMGHYAPLQPLQGSPNGKEGRFLTEESPRVSTNSSKFFYCVLEELLHERLDAGKVGWSVHRPGLLMGSSHRTVFNFVGSLCVYAAICKHLSLPFVFGGTRECWEESYIDGSDARLVAEQHIWAATEDELSSANGEAFNAINGLSFTWREIWPTLGKKLGVRVPEETLSEEFSFSKALGDKAEVWEEIVAEEGLVQTKMEDLANWEFLDVLFRYTGRLLGSREKTDRLGFRMRYKTLDSILYWIDSMRDERFIP